MNEKLAKLPRMAAIHDISGFGKCSLTVALPIISAAGVECSCIPTALLSTHTGVFTDWTFHDLSDNIVPIAEHWNKLGIKFDGIYSGYLASEAQGDLLMQAIRLLADENTMVIVDPAMADNGRYYANLDSRMNECFKKLIMNADVITPNITEACFLTDTEYSAPPYSREFIDGLLERLSVLGPKIVAITGVRTEDGKVGIFARDNETGKCCEAVSEAIEGVFHGSGDVFASAFSALLVRGYETENALNIAEELVMKSIERTAMRGTPTHYGLDFEGVLPEFIRLLEN